MGGSGGGMGLHYVALLQGSQMSAAGFHYGNLTLSI